ncbi:MAG: Rrf2 family transcriptional regulator [Cytophagales bacterium]|nr:MAG: Rrf2 family transcriptional regulator [Cytophagales bacterium]
MFSKSCEYGIKAAIYIASKSQKDERVSLKEIAIAINSPKAFTAKILQLLVKGNIVKSVQGSTGGFEIAKEDLSKIKISKILMAINGVDKYSMCGIGLRECSPKSPCPIHHKYKLIREQINEMLHNSDLKELGHSVNIENTFLNI